MRHAAYGPECNRDPLFYYQPRPVQGQRAWFVDCFPTFEALFSEEAPKQFTGACAVNTFLVAHWERVASDSSSGRLLAATPT